MIIINQKNNKQIKIKKMYQKIIYLQIFFDN